MYDFDRSRRCVVRSLGSASFLFLRGGASSSLLDGGDGISSGAGEVLAEVLQEDDGEMYECRLEKDRLISEGGVGDRDKTETSESDASEGTGLSGELGSRFSEINSMVKGKLPWYA